MKTHFIVIIVLYVTSWTYILVKYIKEKHNIRQFSISERITYKGFEKKIPWYLYLAKYVFAPFYVLSKVEPKIESFFWWKLHYKREVPEMPIKKARKIRNKANLVRYYLANVYEVMKQYFDENELPFVIDESDSSIFFKYADYLYILRKSTNKDLLVIDRMLRVNIEAGREIEAHEMIEYYNRSTPVIKVYLINNYLVFSYELLVRGVVSSDDEFLHQIMNWLILYSGNFFTKEEVRDLFHFSWGEQFIEDIKKIDFSRYPKSIKII